MGEDNFKKFLEGKFHSSMLIKPGTKPQTTFKDDESEAGDQNQTDAA